MKTMLKFVPFVALVVMLSSCGASGGTPDPRDIGHAAFKKIIAKDFDSLDSLMDTWGGDAKAEREVGQWRVKEGYDRWKDFKTILEGDNGMDPKSKSGIDSEEKWTSASFGKEMGLRWGLYKLYAVDDLDKRLGETPWSWGASQRLNIEGQGTAEMTFVNGYGDTITCTMARRDGLWYLTSVKADFAKELPKKPKDD